MVYSTAADLDAMSTESADADTPRPRLQRSSTHDESVPVSVPHSLMDTILLSLDLCLSLLPPQIPAI